MFCRILHNYFPVPGEVTSVDELLSAYRKTTPDKENCLAHFELCRIIRKNFKKIDVKKTKTKEGRKKVYVNLASAERYNQPSLREQISWEALLAYEPKFDFHRGRETEEYLEFTNSSSSDRCNGQRVLREVRITKEFEVLAIVAGKSVTCHDLPRRINNEFDLDNVMFIISASDVCRGFSVLSRRPSKNNKGETTGVCEEWSNEACEYELRHRATKCEGLISLSAKSDMCTVCKTVCKNWGKYLSSPTTQTDDNNKDTQIGKKRKRESLMTREELLEKLQEEKRLKRNALRRENYLREKVNVEMVEFDDEDNNDFVSMFKSVNKESVPEDLHLFWEEQRKALLAKGRTGHRWHPK